MTASRTIHHTLTVPDDCAGRRLDQALAELLPDYSRSRLKAWIESGQVKVGGHESIRPRDKVIGGEQITIDAELEDVEELVAQPIELAIAHEDEHLFVIDKPVGLVVHPGSGNPSGTLLNALLHRDPSLATLPRAGLVHRLDKDTSGLLVVARTIAAHTALVRMLEAREIKREYTAICLGVMTAGGTVDAPIARHPVDRIRMAVREDGRPAITHYRVIRRFRAHTHVRLELESGRTHQIRVHMAHIRYPIVGDAMYGGRLSIPRGSSPEFAHLLRAFKRQALHAARLTFMHPVSGDVIAVDSPLPADMSQLLGALAEDAARFADPVR
jgi:23S rRNA pseudouridine1911/1915/1917 synthase